MNPELQARLENISADIRRDASQLPVLLWLRAYTTLAAERKTLRIRWAKLSGYVSRTARETGMNGLDHAPGRALLTDYALFQAVAVESDANPVTEADLLRTLDLGRHYEIELRPEFQNEFDAVKAWVEQTWQRLKRGQIENSGLAAILARWAPAGQSGLLPALIEAQELEGWLARETLAAIGQALQVPLSQVYGVADFYDHLYTQPVARTFVRVCDDVPCYLAGSADLMHLAKNMLWARENETSHDGRFTLERVPCLGHCDHAPVVMLGHEIRTGVTLDELTALLRE
jgi:NADH-quinone oxidoreductase subunit E